ncbi:uncharacterized protein LOC106012931 [Aplysia californica]|uniref:Uncharacterized protein LOC106012931 n=1 Tax=Aplysia californica TaxID=6500 RepID=A0ABM1A8A5_APLCA|nr:uncharacterized protein LOC106012931 [Aplysia californica]
MSETQHQEPEPRQDTKAEATDREEDRDDKSGTAPQADGHKHKHTTKKKTDSPREKENDATAAQGASSPRGKKETTPSPSESSEGRHKQKEFFKLELQRLESGLKRESSKIIPPNKKPYTPYVFNTLEPYYNTYTTRYLIHLPEEMQHGHTSRRTAQGLTDPWLDLRMDRDLLPQVASKPVSRQVAILKKEKEIRDRKKRSAANQSAASRKEGSTRLPKFPMVHMETQDLATKQLYYSDVPTLRQELKTKYSSSAKTKVDEDYRRTQQDFYRMELDKLDEVHPVNRKHMRSAYFAYLQNTPGSKKAITECVRSLKSGKA